MNKFLIQYRYWFFGITLILSLVCAVLLFHVNINTDMSKYLPDDSNMRAGLKVMNQEFGDLSEMGGADVRVLCNNLSDDERVDLMINLRNKELVRSVNVQKNGKHTLYELGVSDEVDQVALGKELSQEYPSIDAVETSQDGAAAEIPMLLGGVALLLVILFAMCQSWLEPLLFLTSTGIAVLLNVGTNALLPSVSVTTNSIVSILQLVLSIDYSIILINRFRQERQLTDSSIIAMQKAIQKASSSILSSAFTTIIGLIMLVFMKLKIGADLGIVVSKGVLCSLLCNFTILPSLILLFERGIDRSQKRILVLPTDKISHFCLRFRIPLTLLFFTIFIGSFILRSQTNIIFLNAKASKIEKYFPKKNPVVLLYDNADESNVVQLMDSIIEDSGVEMVISYPTLLQREYTAPQMMNAIAELSSVMAGMAPDEMPTFNMDMLSEDVLKVVYYAAHHGSQELTMSFNEMADFILLQAHDPNSLIAKQMDDNLKAQLHMLNEFRHPIATPNVVTHKEEIESSVKKESTEENVFLSSNDAVQKSSAPIVSTNIVEKDDVAKKYSPYTDTLLLKKPLTFSEMATFLTMDESQAKAVYKLARRSNSTMTPFEFVHFVTDDVLQRKALAMMIKDNQKQQLLALQKTIDSTLLSNMHTYSKENAFLKRETSISASHGTAFSTPSATINQETDSIAQILPFVETTTSKQQTKTLDLLDEMLYKNKKYTAHQMAQNIALLGEDIPEVLLELLYLYYGGNQYYDNTWTLSLEAMIHFLVTTTLTDPRFESFLDNEMRANIAQVEQLLTEGIGKLKSKDHSMALIITNYNAESPETYNFIDRYNTLCNKNFKHKYYSIGESIMLSEMKAGFNSEMMLVTLLTIAAIFLIVALTFRSILLSIILVMTVMSGVFINVMVSGIGGGSLLYLAYLVVQSILMGAAIDYGILFANYYREKRATLEIREAIQSSFKNSILTILTSGLILILVPGIMSILVSDPTIADIVRSISIGALATVLLILFLLPSVLATFDKIIIRKKKIH